MVMQSQSQSQPHVVWPDYVVEEDNEEDAFDTLGLMLLDEVYRLKKKKKKNRFEIHNPKHWILAARQEEEAGLVEKAREFINKGCELCPTNEDLWIEACRLSTNPIEVITRGVAHIPNSVNLWMQATKLEPNDAQTLLVRAVDHIPFHVDLWLALACLERRYGAAQAFLNEALQQRPTLHAILIAAAMLQEKQANGTTSKVGIIIRRGVEYLQNSAGVDIDREAWMKEAEAAERACFLETCDAIITHTAAIGLASECCISTWVADAESCEKRGSIETARAIYRRALDWSSAEEIIWHRSVQLEKAHGTRESLDAILRMAVAYIPHVDIFWKIQKQ